jgi:hypothetical protein
MKPVRCGGVLVEPVRVGFGHWFYSPADATVNGTPVTGLPRPVSGLSERNLKKRGLDQIAKNKKEK